MNIKHKKKRAGNKLKNQIPKLTINGFTETFEKKSVKRAKKNEKTSKKRKNKSIL